jgi:hypothetical protein
VHDDERDNGACVVSKDLLRRLVELAFGPKVYEERAYLDANPDVEKAVAKGEFLTGRRHYIWVGITEDRPVSERAFDEIGYLLVNPDVKSAVDEGSFESGREHWQNIGWLEGRAT